MVRVCHLLFDSGYRDHEVYPLRVWVICTKQKPPPFCELLFPISDARCLMPSSGRRVTRKDPRCFILNVNHFLKAAMFALGDGTHKIHAGAAMAHRLRSYAEFSNVSRETKESVMPFPTISSDTPFVLGALAKSKRGQTYATINSDQNSVFQLTGFDSPLLVPFAAGGLSGERR